MNKVENTELEYSEADAVALDFYLGEHSETKIQWAQRVVDMCQEYKDTDGRGHDGNGMSKCYTRTPEDLWEEKKASRRVAVMFELKDRYLNKTETDLLERVRGSKEFVKMEWSNSHSDEETLKLKDEPDYETATAFWHSYKDENLQDQILILSKRKAKLSFYRGTGRTDENILLTHPELTGTLELEAKEINLEPEVIV